MSDRVIEPFNTPFTASLTPPGSKSLTNRALVLAAMADGVSTLNNILFADDSRVMLAGLQSLGFDLQIDESTCIVKVAGLSGNIPARSAEIFCGNSGTTIRFLAALCALGHGEFALDGIARMRQRPIAELAELLGHLGTRVRFLEAEGFPPLMLYADGLPGGLLHYGSAASSQFLSAVLMVAPFARHEVQVDLHAKQTSWPYVAMTMQLMDRFGHTPELERDPLTGQPRRIIVPQGRYASTEYTIEPDASNAMYFLATAAVHPGAKVTIEGLGKHSLQGDAAFADVLHRMGAGLVFGRDFITVMGEESLNGIDIDLSDMPDQAQTLAAVALFAKGTTTIRGLHTLKLKETDRLAALSNELFKLGAKVEIANGDTLIIHPPANLRPAAIDTYDDHRMAMSFAIVATKISGITINNAECVNKTYPDFFVDMEKLKGL